MGDTGVREAIERLSTAIRAQPAKAKSKNARGILGLDEKVSAGLNPMRTKVRIGGDAEPQALQALVEWAEAHSPVGCTIKNAAACLLDIEVI